MKLIELFEDVLIKETSTAGSTSAGNIATFVGTLNSGFSDEFWRSVYQTDHEKFKKNKKNQKKYEKSPPIVIRR